MNSLRELKPDDSAMLLHWRNLPEVAQYMYTDHIITPAEHARWFERIRHDPTCRYWIIVCDDRDVGLVNITGIDLQNHRCEWGLYLADPAVRGKGVGRFVQYSILTYAFDELGLNKVCCEAFAFNHAALHLYESMGFQREGCFREHYVKAGIPRDIVCLAILNQQWQALKPELTAALQAQGIL